ncbi:4'-phosphopantetheinyl transferase family protein [Streptomyces sp. NPDC101118]|uniref:4'-phosphopantetheinyl transferase family protein n=1 Tax=Streptomyces sp. NPDC101118 TaxID=3366109 RepID=UPI00380E41E1
MPVPHGSPGSLTLDPALRADAEQAVRALRASGEVHVWWWALPARTDPDDLALLNTAEYERALRFHAERDAAGFVRAHASARRALAGLLGVPAAEVDLGRRVCPGCGDGSHGPPSVLRPAVPLAVSLSRTDGLGVLAVRAGTRVGVDVEARRDVRADTLAELVLSESERRVLAGLAPGPDRDAAFHRCWTRKEAVVKAVGVGLIGTELTALEVHMEDDGPVAVSHSHQGVNTLWSVSDLDVGAGYTAALARPDRSATGPVVLHPPV